MQAETRNLVQVLAGDKRFIVPTYQRPYVWSRDQRWEPLWQDIIDTAQRLSEARHDAAAKDLHPDKADENAAPHFLGAVVLDQLPTQVGELDIRSVVDGQQRLTTIQLMLRGVLDALEGRDVSARLKAQVRKLILNDEEVIPDDESRYKVWPRMAERHEFVAAMTTVDDQATKFAEAREYFRGAAVEWLTDSYSPTAPGDGTDEERRAALLVSSLRGLLKLVVIDLDGVDDAQVIFEVLNARHTPLTAADLVKNLLFMRAERAHQDVDKLYFEYWARFDDPWWSKEVGVGHATRPRQDWLLGDWLIARSGKVVSVSHMYGSVKGWLDATGEKVEDALASIAEYAEAYRQLQRESAGPPRAEVRAFENIGALGVTAANPLLLWLMTRATDDLPADERTRAIAAVESYLIRRMATKAQTRAYGSVFVEVLQAVQSADGPIADALEAALLSSPHGYAWPTDRDVASSFEGSRYYGAGGINRRRLALLLGAVDHRLHASDPLSEDVQIEYAKLQVEHVLPQKWQSNWPVSSESADGQLMAEQQREQHVHRIGNLTLVTDKLNPKLSNASWDVKRPELAKHSVLQLNALICEEDVWDEEHITSRAKLLAQHVAAAWPGPDEPRDAVTAQVPPNKTDEEPPGNVEDGREVVDRLLADELAPLLQEAGLDDARVELTLERLASWTAQPDYAKAREALEALLDGSVRVRVDGGAYEAGLATVVADLVSVVEDPDLIATSLLVGAVGSGGASDKHVPAFRHMVAADRPVVHGAEGERPTHPVPGVDNPRQARLAYARLVGYAGSDDSRGTAARGHASTANALDA